MKNKLTKHKKLRRNYKHFAAALAGVAIMAGTTLHGIPLAKAAAAEKPLMSPPAANEQTTPIDKDTKVPITNPTVTSDQHDKNKETRHDHRHQRDDRYDHERWADRHHPLHQRIAWYNDSLNKIQIYNDEATPVNIVMTAADILGFDVNNDTFILLSQNGSLSIVRVVHDGTNYDITVEQLSNGNWLISFINAS